MIYPDILLAIKSLNAEPDVVVVFDNTYEGIQWVDQPTLTKQQVEDELERLKAQFEAAQYQRLRAQEYPDFRDYLDGIVKGDQAQIDDYIQKCLAVKAKYPKPS